VNSDGISSSSSPFDYVLAMGLPGEALLRTAADFTPVPGSSLMINDGIHQGNWWLIGGGVFFLTLDIATFGSGSLIRGGAKTAVKAMAAKGSTTAFRSFTASNFRTNLGKLTGHVPANSQDHHIFPQKFLSEFSKRGINIHDPKFGSWSETSDHLKNATGYNAAWADFFRAYPDATQSQILNHGRTLMQQYGISVGF
jgi:hypothetical protein